MTGKSLEHKKTVMDMVRSYLPDFKKTIPKHVDPERMMRLFLTELSRNPKLLQCSQESLIGAMMQCTQFGLEPGGPLGLAHLVPYQNKYTNSYECQFQFGYRGLVKLIRNSGELRKITAHVVYEKDIFDFEYGLNERLEYKPYLGKDRGLATCAYAHAVMKDGTNEFIVLTLEELNKVENSAKSKSGPWKDWKPEMQKKTCIKRLSKLMDLSTEVQTAIGQDETTKFYSKDINILEAPDETDWNEKKELPSAKAQKVEKKLTKRAAYLLEEMEKHYGPKSEKSDNMILSVLNAVTRTPESPENDGINSFFDLTERRAETAFFRWKALLLFQQIKEEIGSQKEALRYLTEATTNPKKEIPGLENISQVNSKETYGILKTRFLADKKDGLFENAEKGK
jgi:recombination protein RecT